MEASPLAILVLDLDMSVTMWNPAAERMFGWSKEEILGQPYPLVPAEREQSFQELFNRVVGGSGFTGVEARRAQGW